MVFFSTSPKLTKAKWLLPVLFLLLGIGIWKAFPPAEPLLAKNVVILVIDGPRYSETWGEPGKKYIPHLAKDLAPLGVLFPNFRNEGPTYTNAGHGAISTGFYQEIENSKGTQLPDHPGLFQRFLKASGLPSSSAWVITSKDKLQILINCADPRWKDKYLASTDCGPGGKGPGSGYREDPETFAAVKRVLEKDHPRLVLINLKGPDSMGHSNNWRGYLKAIRQTDGMAWDLWRLLQSDSFYRDQTVFFLTNDHGRHLDGQANGFIDHGDSCEGCRHILLFAAGPDFKRGTVIAEKREQIDLAATAAKILGFSIPGSRGRNMTELFAPRP